MGSLPTDSEENRPATAPEGAMDLYFAHHAATGETWGPVPHSTIIEWISTSKLSSSDHVCKSGDKEWTEIGSSELAIHSPGVANVISDLQFGPVDRKLDAIRDLPWHRAARLAASPYLLDIIARYGIESNLSFRAAAALARLRIADDTTIPILAARLSDKNISADIAEGKQLPVIYADDDFIKYIRTFSFLLPTVSALEALSYMKDNTDVVYSLLDVLERLTNERWRTLVIYALGALGHPDSKPVLIYYRDRWGDALDGEAARICLENFGHFSFSSLNHSHLNLRESRKKKKGSVIATVVYGSESSEEVKTLKLFRDQVLASSFFGRLLTDIYYALSPRLKWLFTNSSGLRWLTKKILDPVVVRAARRLAEGRADGNDIKINTQRG